jgi:hypothetical protein
MAHYLRTLIETLERGRERKLLRDARRNDNATDAERLEHIALYARAGYFNMGYTVDAFHMPGDSLTH